MQDSLVDGTGMTTAGHLTLSEIEQQTELWPATLRAVQEFTRETASETGRAVITGAGSSAYAAFSVAKAWPDAIAKPSTDLLVEDLQPLQSVRMLVSLGRSGDSPESIGVVNRLMQELPDMEHLAITCNAEGQLARAAGVKALVLDPRTNDRSLVMTSSFTNLALAGMAFHSLPVLARELGPICSRVDNSLAELRASAAVIAARNPTRIVFLASGALLGAALEGALKVLEMTAGSVVTYAETFLGLRHGPMSFLRGDTTVICFLSSNPRLRQYEEDVIEELREKQLGYIVGITAGDWREQGLHLRVPANAPGLADELRTPFEIVFAQLLGLELSLRAGLNPDSPSPDGVITRVVRGFRIHSGAQPESALASAHKEV